jgi:hypothetical protein
MYEKQLSLNKLNFVKRQLSFFIEKRVLQETGSIFLEIPMASFLEAPVIF